MPVDDRRDEDLRRLRLRLIIDQANRYEDAELPLADLAHGVETLIFALGHESDDEESVHILQPIWGSIEIINAACLDADRDPSPTEGEDLRRDIARLREAASSRLEQAR